MKNTTDILDYHISHKLKRLSPKHCAGLTIKQKEQLQAQLDLHYKLGDVSIKKSRGYGALEQALRKIEAESAPKKPWYLNVRLQLASVSVVAIFALAFVGGLRLFGGTQSTTTSNLSQSSVVANGSVDNLNNLNLLDAQNDIKVSSVDDSVVNTAQAELSGTSKLDEVVNANF